jgi:hypothetical protein
MNVEAKKPRGALHLVRLPRFGNSWRKRQKKQSVFANDFASSPCERLPDRSG